MHFARLGKGEFCTEFDIVEFQGSPGGDGRG